MVRPSKMVKKKAFTQAPVKKAPAKPIKRKQAEPESESEEDFENVSIDMASDDEVEGDLESDEEPEPFPEYNSQSEEEEEEEEEGEGESSDDYVAGDSVDEDEDLEEEEEDAEDYDFGDSDGTEEPKEIQDWRPVDHEGRRKLLPHIEADYDSDSSTEETGNTVGNIPMEWYDDYPHIGYDLDGKKIMRPAKGDELDSFLAKMDDPDNWRSVEDKLHQQDVVLTDQELDIIRRLQEGRIPDADYDPYEPWTDFFTSKTSIHPVNNAPEPKSRFIPSKWEHKRIMKIVRAIREGRILPKKTQVEKPRFYNLWNDDDQPRDDHPMHIPAPKMKLPDNSESYNPPEEYLPTPEEIEEWENMEPEERARNYLPKKYNSLREVPGYSRFMQERFQRNLDLYLCPRVRKNRLNIDPESLIPKLPSPKDLQPFPTTLSITYKGHEGRIRSFSVDPSGLWVVSGSDDKTVKLWEVSTGRCIQTWAFDEIITSVSWNPNRDLCFFAVATANKVHLIAAKKVFDSECQLLTEQFLQSGFQAKKGSEGEQTKKHVQWTKGEDDVQLILTFKKDVKEVKWHKKGDYMATVCPDDSTSILIHQVSKHQSQAPFRKTKGQVQSVTFHPTKPLFFVATQRYIRIYNLMKQELAKTLQPGVKWISSLDIHPQGDNVIMGSYDKRLCWFDLDLSSKPYKTLRYHTKALRSVAYHKRYPLFASSSDDGTIQIFHGMVYNDLLQNPLVVPVKILRGHEVVDHLGVLDCEFHPTQPWIFSSGADSTLRLFT
ncbi:BOP1NT-domain-containing protein [Basidiobolus meristosporus CBS 931.73]|uniref:Ribosome biogenesis protein ERB1 n=1 Tax=Basidiobolus meristosporus CBS 931.73 TaxID=1314790 RepID=A0A1Y1ZAP4_9FUNG|nr:BOP1NT-domain-containing protein [Basidiobolus meristosporus CBS 931.73]|eukprot:ORY07319.1 BOP1NT-domain-containing protein [Basidiobolus meristosporus CBS 931.73]